MPRTEAANQRIREEQRARILEAARKVFARKGMAATMAEVAAEAEVSQGLAYRYFANKKAIFNVLVEQMMQSGPTMAQHILEMPGTRGERFDFFFSKMGKSGPKSPNFYQFFYQLLFDKRM